jgi:hypothetical protein
MSRKYLFIVLFAGVLPFGRAVAQGGASGLARGGTSAPAAAQGDGLAPRVKAQAQKMAAALVKGDYPTFVHFMNPAIIRMIGGEAAMKKQMATLDSTMKKQGATFGKIVIGDATKIVSSGKELQCTVSQESEILAKGGSMKTKSTLIAISADGGKTWTFLDTVNKDLTAVRQLLPNLNPAISFPPSQRVLN